jgi:RNA-binding motif X-linked protein 2
MLINVINKPCFIQLLSRTIRVDHVTDYKPPKDSEKLDEETRKLHSEGCAPLHAAPPIKHEEGESVKNKMLII